MVPSARNFSDTFRRSNVPNRYHLSHLKRMPLDKHSGVHQRLHDFRDALTRVAFGVRSAATWSLEVIYVLASCESSLVRTTKVSVILSHIDRGAFCRTDVTRDLWRLERRDQQKTMKSQLVHKSDGSLRSFLPFTHQVDEISCK
jgi:hypothetical protein